MARQTGIYRASSTAGESVQAVVPHPLPPVDPPLSLDADSHRLHDEAVTAITRLELAGRLVPSTNWFLYGFVRKEAVLTSQIEGTQATLRDVLEYEATDVTDRPDDVEEVCNYVAALTYARKQLARSKGLPMSVRLLCEAHKRLLKGARGSNKQPGRIRSTQNWIGGSRPGNARFVPPPPESVTEALAALEKWIHSADALPPLVRTGLAHAQFETIHPFLDGNGRIGRLLITLLLEQWGLMTTPLLYLSVAFKRRQHEYYDRLSAVRTNGDWEGWTSFYLNCVCEAAHDGVDVAQRLFALLGRDRNRLMENDRATIAAVRLFDRLPENPIVNVPRVEALLGVTQPTANKAVDVLTDVGILHETSGRQRDRVFAYQAYLKILTADEQ